MRILFHVTGYKSPEQFSWLFSAIYNPVDLFIVHVDRKSSSAIHLKYQEVADNAENVIFLPSIDVIWGGFGLIQAEMLALRVGLTSDVKWSYVINLTAQDYPIIPIDSIRAQLEAAYPANFVSCLPLSSVHWRIRKRRWFRHVDGKARRHWTPLPLMPKRGIKMQWYGPWWHIITRDFCAWWLSSEKANSYVEAHAAIGMPDEMLVQNLIHDSPFRTTLRSECKHKIIWRYPWEPRSCSARPNVLTLNDLPCIAASNAFFARKFDHEVDSEVLSVLADKIQAPSPKAA